MKTTHFIAMAFPRIGSNQEVYHGPPRLTVEEAEEDARAVLHEYPTAVVYPAYPGRYHKNDWVPWMLSGPSKSLIRQELDRH